ncbi:MAG: DUF1674 domain-containing protein [Rhodobiaceae bacterium]|nr:DUF1674 domain-containing protein [Rhodobiaceae bacterium]MCC0016190.1 DUF1674 domain-containing protein [Rhodobiaceae bacterium]MCC0041205.1 DUF1674 domain-containing protein [Rhodobiaceae bacterium]
MVAIPQRTKGIEVTRADDATTTEDFRRQRIAEAAQRARAEAEARRAAADAGNPPRPREINGRDGPEPVRYGDWEVGGLATDF